MLTVFWCSTSYTVLIVLWKMLIELVKAPARWWPCARLKCFSGLRRLEKTLNILRCIHVNDLVLKYGSDINEGNLIQLLFYFIVLMGIVDSEIGMSFLSFVSGFRLKFVSYCTLTETFAIGFQKRCDHDWIDFGVFFGKGLFRRLHICMDWTLLELLNFCSFLTISNFFDVYFEGYSGLFFKNACSF